MANTGGILSGAASGAAAGSVLGPWGTVIGGLAGGIGGLLSGGTQSAPQQAVYQPVNPTQVASQTIAGNQANLGAAENLASSTNSFNQSQATALMNQAMPGFSQLQQNLLNQVNQSLNSETSLPQSVSDKLSQVAAEQGVSRGTSGNFNGFDLVKDFGFNLIDWQNAQRTNALQTLSSAYGMTPRVNPMSPMSMFVDPSQAIQSQTMNNNMAYNATQAGYNAQTAASNYNNLLGAGMFQNGMSTLANKAGTIASSFGVYNGNNGGVQSKVLSTPAANGDTMTPYVVNGSNP